jgi:hypothetical protein
MAKLVTLAVVVVAAAGGLSVLISWYYQPYFAAGNRAMALSQWSPLASPLFDLRGFAFAAWTLVRSHRPPLPTGPRSRRRLVRQVLRGSSLLAALTTA